MISRRFFFFSRLFALLVANVAVLSSALGQEYGAPRTSGQTPAPQQSVQTPTPNNPPNALIDNAAALLRQHEEEKKREIGSAEQPALPEGVVRAKPDSNSAQTPGAASNPVADPNANATPGVQTPGAQGVPTAWSGRTLALLVGYDVYEQNQVKLPEFAQEDAEAVANELLRRGVPNNNIVRLTSASPNFSGKPTRELILAAAANLARESRPSDALVVVVSGSGASLSGESFFLAQYSEAANPEAWLGARELIATLSRARAKRVLVLWLCGRLDNRAALGETIKERLAVELQAPPEGAQRVVLFACGSNQFANESLDARRDLFLKNFLNALRATDSWEQVDWSSTLDAVVQETAQETANFDMPQKPEILAF